VPASVVRVPGDADHVEKLQSFRTFVQKQIAEHKIRNDNIINMDEVPLTFDIPMNPYS
jgi:hypothetical protein